MDGGQADDTIRLRGAEAARRAGLPSAAAPHAPRRGPGLLVPAMIGLALLGAAGLGAVLVWGGDGPSAPGARVDPALATPSPLVDPAARMAAERIIPSDGPRLAPTPERDGPQQLALAPVGPNVPPAASPTRSDAPVAGDPAAGDAARGLSVLPSPAAPRSPEPPPLATEAELVATVAERPLMRRLRENPAVFVLLFPTLEEQGAAFNRIAALVEKAGLPRDRLLNDEDLAVAIQRSGDTPATWYLGHDYQGADLARFFALAARDGIALNPSEAWMQDRFREARALVPEGSEIALISTANADHRFDAAMRAAILRHEIAHGHFFTRPEVRAHVLQVWRKRFRERDRQAIRGFLEREGYDTSNDLLMANEAMAYLLFTPEQRFFSARHLGMTEADLTRLRGLMREGLPIP